MNAVERVKKICKERGIPIYVLEKDCGFSNGYIRKLTKGSFPNDRLSIIARYLNVSEMYLTTGKEAPKEPQSSMERKTIAHDLALIKLNGSDLPTAELLAKYKEYYSEIFSMLDSPAPVRKAQVTRSPI